MEFAGYLKCYRAVVNTFLHQLIAIVAVYSIWSSLLNISGLLSWHIILCTLGLFPLMAEAMILFHKDNVYNVGLSEEAIKRNHFIVMIFSIVFLCAGIGLEIFRTHRNGADHFVTTHGILGLVALIVLILATASGIASQVLVAIQSHYRPILGLVHDFLGVFSYVFAVAGLCSGYYSDWFFQSSESKIAATVVSVAICLWSLVYSFISIFNQIKQLHK